MSDLVVSRIVFSGLLYLYFMLSKRKIHWRTIYAYYITLYLKSKLRIIKNLILNIIIMNNNVICA